MRFWKRAEKAYGRAGENGGGTEAGSNEKQDPPPLPLSSPSFRFPVLPF